MSTSYTPNHYKFTNDKYLESFVPADTMPYFYNYGREGRMLYISKHPWEVGAYDKYTETMYDICNAQAYEWYEKQTGLILCIQVGCN
jgi:hypothetical protein